MNKKVKLGKIVDKIGSGATPKGGEKNYEKYGVSLIRSQNVLDFKFNKGNLAHINEKQADLLSNVEVLPNDILFNITGDSIARCCIVPNEVLPARVNQHVTIIRLKEEKYSRYVMYYLQYLKKYLLNICRVGGTRKAFTKEALEDLPVFIHDDAERIGTFLKTLDDTISNNNKINATMESMAKNLYDYWFLQFDFPDENGKPYRRSGGEMVWNEELKREIPVGWDVGILKDYVDIQSTTIDPPKHADTLFEHYSIPAYDETHYPVMDYGRQIDSGKYIVPQGTILYAKLNPVFQRLWLPYCITDNAICSTEFMVYMPLKKQNMPYVYGVLNNNSFQNYLINQSSSSTGSRKRVQPEDSLLFPVFIPNKKILKMFNQLVCPFLEEMKKCFIENQQLTSLRDFLLPMLMNGQISFKD